MKSKWRRRDAPLSLDRAALTALIQPVFPGASVSAGAPVDGGLSNTSLRLSISGRSAPLMLRVFTRHPERAEVELAATRRAAESVPVPAVLHFAPSNPFTGHPYALFEWVEGERLDLAFAAASCAEQVEMGQRIGAAMAQLHAIRFEQYGFFDATLAVSHPITLGSTGLGAYLRQCFVDGRGGARLGGEPTQRLLAFADQHGGALDLADGRPCLAHGDFSGSNILMRQTEGGWRVAAILDWEYALSATPFFDLANLLRPPVGDAPEFTAAMARGYRAAGGELPQDWQRLSRMTDLFAWADLLSRADCGEEVIADGRLMIARILADA